MKYISFFLLIAISIFSLAFVGPCERMAFWSSEKTAERQEPILEENQAPPPHPEQENSVRYRQLLRDAEREYQEGALTRTEFIQRKRELNSLYK